jgi:F-type H+-transporting ATPase subunit epsilon
MSLSVRILTLNGVLWAAAVEELILPSSTGLLGILPGHASLITSLDIGVVRMRSGKDPVVIVVIEGFAEIRKGEVIIVSNTAEVGSLLDLEVAREDVARVTKLAENAVTKKDKLEAALEVRKSRARLEAVMGAVA